METAWLYGAVPDMDRYLPPTTYENKVSAQ